MGARLSPKTVGSLQWRSAPRRPALPGARLFKGALLCQGAPAACSEKPEQGPGRRRGLQPPGDISAGLDSSLQWATRPGRSFRVDQGPEEYLVGTCGPHPRWPRGQGAPCFLIQPSVPLFLSPWAGCFPRPNASTAAFLSPALFLPSAPAPAPPCCPLLCCSWRPACTFSLLYWPPLRL